MSDMFDGVKVGDWVLSGEGPERTTGMTKLLLFTEDDRGRQHTYRREDGAFLGPKGEYHTYFAIRPCTPAESARLTLKHLDWSQVPDALVLDVAAKVGGEAR